MTRATVSVDASPTRMVARNLTRAMDLARELEVADRLFAKFMGLMGRPALPDGAGMWLTGTNGIHMMFMRFPIDAVFLGRPAEGEGAGHAGPRPVLSVHPGLRAWTGIVPLVRGAAGVLELPVGTIARTGTAVGDQVMVGSAEAVASTAEAARSVATP